MSRYPKITVSTRYKHWVSRADSRRCQDCEDNHGKIWLVEETPRPKPPIHFACRCTIERMSAIAAGAATIHGVNGADWTLKYEGRLPEYYVTEAEAKAAGWKPSKWPSNFVPGKVITKGIYKNLNNHLPQVSGRIWYEADINYEKGKRNDQRVVWSNDGLMFVTYDHYKTFYEII